MKRALLFSLMIIFQGLLIKELWAQESGDDKVRVISPARKPSDQKEEIVLGQVRTNTFDSSACNFSRRNPKEDLLQGPLKENGKSKGAEEI